MTDATSHYLNRPLRSFDQACIDRGLKLSDAAWNEWIARHPEIWTRRVHRGRPGDPVAVVYFTDQPGDDDEL